MVSSAIAALDTELSAFLDTFTLPGALEETFLLPLHLDQLYQFCLRPAVQILHAALDPSLSGTPVCPVLDGESRDLVRAALSRLVRFLVGPFPNVSILSAYSLVLNIVMFREF